MMFALLRKKLEALPCAAWELTEQRRRGWEFYFIRRRLDQHRAVDVRSYTLRVYVPLDGGRSLGRAEAELPPTASEAELDRALEALLFRAGLAGNPAYTLTDTPVPLPEREDAPDLEAIAGDFLDAVRAVPETEGEDVNSFELFVSGVARHTLNSNGVEARCSYPSSMLELVVNARRAGREIELYRNFRSGTCDREKLLRDASAALRCARDRLSAQPTPKADGIDVVFSGADAAELYRYFAARMDASMKYRRLSDWEPGQPVGAGDKLCLEALPALENSSKNFPVDAEGSVILPRFLIRDGRAEQFWGERQYSRYLGLEQSSIVSNFRASGGNGDAAALLAGDCLEVAEFSALEVDPAGGDLAGEIRLGYLHRGGETIAVTGGSVSGSLRAAAPSLRMSAARERCDCWEIPALTRLSGLRVAGS